jgi:hypothetical protein
MNNLASLLSALPVETFDDPRPSDAWDHSPLVSLSDAALIDAATQIIAIPKIAKPSSFVLHAPLELLARAQLLRHVSPDTRAPARRQIAAVAVRYAHAGASIDDPEVTHSNVATALAALIGGLHDGDVNAVDGAFLFVAPRVPAAALRHVLVDEIAPQLGAAGHAPMLLAALKRSADGNAINLLRAPLRMLAANSSLRLTWFNAEPSPESPTEKTTLFDRLAAPNRVTSPSSSIAPMALAVERNGEAMRLLQAPVHQLSAQKAEQILLRVAAYSMLQDDAAQAPYGWTHCLTLPRGLLQNADASSNHRALVAVAATHVLASRAILSRGAIHAIAPPQTNEVSVDGVDPATAASAAFHANISRRREIMTTLANNAARHHDAHLVKYTLACFEAAAIDTAAAPLFLAAAAYLGAWWQNKRRA